jgi:single-stranded DNA-binding protein
MKNRVLLEGIVYTHPEISTNAQGQKYAKFMLKVQDAYQTADGFLNEQTDWFNISVFRHDLVDLCQSTLHKDNPLRLEGSLVTCFETDPEDLSVNIVDIQLSRQEAALNLLTQEGMRGTLQ